MCYGNVCGLCYLLCAICCVLNRLTNFLPSFLSNISPVTESREVDNFGYLAGQSKTELSKKTNYVGKNAIENSKNNEFIVIRLDKKSE